MIREQAVDRQVKARGETGRRMLSCEREGVGSLRMLDVVCRIIETVMQHSTQAVRYCF